MPNYKNHRGLRAARSTIAAAFGVLAATQSGLSAVPASAEADSVSRLPNFPNDFALFDQVAASASYGTFLISDAANHLLIEVSAPSDWGASYPKVQSCPNVPASTVAPSFPAEWVEYNPDTPVPIAAACGLPTVDGQLTVRSADNTPGPDIQTAVVDSVDGLVFVPCLCGTVTSFPNTRTIMAVSERPLGIVGDFCVVATAADPCTTTSPAGSVPDLSGTPYPYLQDLSWYGGTPEHPADDLVALSDNYETRDAVQGNPDFPYQEPLGVAVTDYRIAHDSSGALQLRSQWTIHLGPNICQRALTDQEGQTAEAVRATDGAGDQALFVPCTTATATATTIVKVPLHDDGTLAGDPSTDPSVKVEALIAPFPGQDFLFDPKAERGYLLPSILSPDGFVIAVYDGGARLNSQAPVRPSSFIGRMAVAQDALNAFALDQSTGRLYIDDSLNGSLRLIDGRHNQVSPGRPFGELFPKEPVGTYQGAVVTPDAKYPYTRVFFPNSTPAAANAPPVMSYVTVIADQVPVSPDAPPSVVDEKTYPGAIPSGATVTTTYAGHAAGYGVQADLVGGYLGPVDNSAAREPVAVPPAARDTIDLHAGSVQGSQVVDGSASAKAAAVADANGNATHADVSCSDASSTQSCMPLECGNVLGFPLPADGCSTAQGLVAGRPTACPTPGNVMDPCRTASTTSTAQEWPFPSTECSQPGPNELEGRQTATGVRYTPVHANETSSPSPTPTPRPTAPETSSASAVADCTNSPDGTPRASATGQLGCTGAESPPMPSASSTPNPFALPDLQCADGASPFTIDSVTLAPILTLTNAYAETLINAPSGQSGVVESTVTAVAQGVHLDLGGGIRLDIDQITQTVRAQAGGRPGTAHTIRGVTLEGVTLARPGFSTITICVKPHTCSGDQGLLDQINALDPAHLYATLPSPDEPFGTELDGVSPAGSPGGYQATVEANDAEQQGDALFNAMKGFNGDGTEKTLLPALRLVVNDPGATTVSRMVLDFAGVEADTTLGLDVFQDDFASGTGTVDTTQAMIAAGAPPTTYEPGTPGIPPFPGQAAPTSYHTGLLGVLERALSGLGWLVRSPLAALQMGGFLILLGLPVMLIRRRWTWQPGLREEG